MVVKGLISTIEHARYLYEPSNDGVQQRLYDHVPELYEVDDVVDEYWSRHGYRDYRLERPHLIPSHVSEGSFGSHTDYKGLPARRLVGPLSASIGLTESAQYYAQKPDRHFKNPDGSFDAKSWVTWQAIQAPESPRSSVLQEAGDGVFFVNHPRQSYHAIQAVDGTKRKATLLDYWITKIS